MLGFIAALTPILYKQVTERREEIDNINEANKLLLLKNATKEYIETNKDSISIGNMVISPEEIGIEISGYQIGIRKENDGTIQAMIASDKGGTDIQAGKIASLLGISAGIYSDQDTKKAWGINGVWAEDISNYGFTSLPTGIPVVTTAYDKDLYYLGTDAINDILENNSYDRIRAKEICIDNPDIPEDEQCITEWNISSFNAMEVISQCTLDTENGVQDSSTCEKGWEKHLNRSCGEISSKYKGSGSKAPSGIYAITTSKSDRELRACYFVNGELPTNEQLIIGTKNDPIARRYDWENQRISSNCNTIISNWSMAPSDFYTFVNGENSYTTSNICVFESGRIATNIEVITQCNSSSGSGAACRYGWNNNLNRSCSTIIATNPSATTGFYNITTSSSASLQPCAFTGNRIATSLEVVNLCNSSNNAASAACRYGWNNNINRSCSSITSLSSAKCSTSNIITTASSGSKQTCSCCQLVPGQTLSRNLTTPYTLPCSGYYNVCAMGKSSCVDHLLGAHITTYGSQYCTRAYLNKGSIIKATIYEGGWNPAGGYWSCTGGDGVVIFIDNSVLVAAGGGTGSGCNRNGVCHVSGGGGYQGGCGYCHYSEDTSGRCNGKGYLTTCGNQQNYCGMGSCWREGDSTQAGSTLVYSAQQ